VELRHFQSGKQAVDNSSTNRVASPPFVPRLLHTRPTHPKVAIDLQTTISLHTSTAIIMAEKEGSAVPPQSRGSWTSFLKVMSLSCCDNPS
jgi:hypothetical protein